MSHTETPTESHPQNDTETTSLPDVVVGAGPIGLAAAAHLLERGLDPLVLEAGPQPPPRCARGAHVRLFSTWAELVDPAAEKLLAPTGWTAPTGDRYPTGGDWADALPPAARRRPRRPGPLRRHGHRRRPRRPRPRSSTPAATSSRSPCTSAHADGTRGAAPGPRRRSTPPAPGPPPTRSAATATRPSASRPPPSASPTASPTSTTRRTRPLRAAGAPRSSAPAPPPSPPSPASPTWPRREPGTTAVWVLRRGVVGSTFGGGDADQLPARGALGPAAAQGRRGRPRRGRHRLPHRRRRARRRRRAGAWPYLVSEDGRRLDPVDEVIVLTGFRPDHSFLSELRLSLDDRLQAPVALAPLIDPNVHSCGTVYPHGADELSHPEEGVYLVGMKSYGRAPTFLAMTGYEQVRSVAAALAGDHEAAEPGRADPARDRRLRRRRTLRRRRRRTDRPPAAAAARPRRPLLQIGAPAGSASC